MKRSWRRILPWLVSVPAALAGVATLLPRLVDGDDLKPTVIAAAARATGQGIAIDGPVSFEILPLPRLEMGRLRFVGPPGAREAATAEAERAEARLSWRGLLAGRLVVESLRLHRLRIVLETAPDGRLNWQPAATAVDRPAGEAGPAIDRVEIVQGTVVHTDRRSGRTLEAEDIGLVVSPGRGDRPLRVAGTATVDRVPIVLDLEVGSAESSGRALRARAQLPGGRIAFAGTASALSIDAALAGKLSLASDRPPQFVDALVQLSGHRPVQLSDRVAHRLDLDATIEVSPQRIALEDFQFAISDQTAGGTLVLTRGPAPSLTGRLVLSRIDADHWLKIAQDKAFLAIGPQGQLERGKNAPRPPLVSTLPEGSRIDVGLEVAEILYRRQPIRQVSTRIYVRRGLIRFPEVRAILPGDMTLHSRSAPGWEDPHSNRDGRIELAGDRLRDTLNWLGIDTEGIPATRLRTLRAEGQVRLTRSRVLTSDVKFSLDGAEGTGSGALDFAIPVVLTSNIELATFELDGYVPLPGRPSHSPGVRQDADRDKTPKRSGTSPPGSLPLPKFAVKARIGNLVYRGQEAEGVEADFVAQGKRLDLNRLRVRRVLGTTIEASGTLADYGSLPRFDVVYLARMSDADLVFNRLGLPSFINGRIGAALSTGTLSGTLRDVAVRQLMVNMLDTSFLASGTVRLGEDFAFDFPNFSMQTSDAARLLATATGSAFPEIGPVVASGTFRGDTRKAAFGGTLDLLGSHMTGRVSTTLDAHPSVTAEVQVSGTFPLARLIPGGNPPKTAPAPARPSAAPPADAGFDFLRSFDASLTLSAEAVTYGAAKVAVTELSAGLHNGNLRIARLGGMLYGGTFALNGGVDASVVHPAVALSGDLLDIDVGSTLGTLRGSNSFGNDQYTIVADGRLSVTTLEITGDGASVGDIARSLVVRGRLGGSLRPMMTRGSHSLASFGTGLGSLFSTRMGLGSAILDGFIDRWSTLDGEVSFADGTISLTNESIQGNGAKAVVNGRNDLRRSTTDTSVTFEIGTPGPTDYVLTINGPITSPTVGVRGGAGR